MTRSFPLILLPITLLIFGIVTTPKSTRSQESILLTKHNLFKTPSTQLSQQHLISEAEKSSLIYGPFYIVDVTNVSTVVKEELPQTASRQEVNSPTPLLDSTKQDSWWARQSKESKLLYTNVFAATVVSLYGLSEWDYGGTGFQTADEGWFNHDTIHGGADKMGHFWATYTFSDALTGLYKHWGYEAKKANRYAAWSAWGVQAFMELADATSEDQGFSWEDLVMNSLGALTSVFMANNPSLDDKIDFRLEYVFNEEVNNFFDDYSNHYYSIVLKLDGFESIENNFLQYLEFHAGYYTRGYDKAEDENVRSVYAGISLNFSKFFNKHGWNKTGKTFEYLQIPYTVIKASEDLD